MQFPQRFSDLPTYAFPRLRALLDHHTPGGDVVHMTIGEPKHAFPAWVMDEITAHAAGFNRYPPNDGAPELRGAISDWLLRRYGVRYDPDTRILPLNGTREGLYNICMALVPEEKNGRKPTIMMPNPFYQVYMLSALSVEAEPIFVSADASNGYLPDFAHVDHDILQRCAAVFVCSPSNPQGAVADADYWKNLIQLAERYDFRIFADECYCEIYRKDPPPGALQIAHEMGADPERVIAFHSLSKRSNLPGLRSGFVAGGPAGIAAALKLRMYAGAPLPMPLQMAAAAVWSDEAHVTQNRILYQEKYRVADRIFDGIPGYMSPQAGFFLWLPVPDGEAAALKLWQASGVRVLPGAYLARENKNHNPGQGYIRAALVDTPDQVKRGLRAIRDVLYPG